MLYIVIKKLEVFIGNKINQHFGAEEVNSKIGLPLFIPIKWVPISTKYQVWVPSKNKFQSLSQWSLKGIRVQVSLIIIKFRVKVLSRN